MGIGASKGQGNEATYEKRDVETVLADKSNWPELAGAKLAESNGSGRKSYSSSKIISRPMRSLTPNMGDLVQREDPQN